MNDLATKPGALLQKRLFAKLAQATSTKPEKLEELFQQSQEKDHSFLELGQKTKLFKPKDYQKALADTLGLEFLETLKDLEPENQVAFTEKIPIRFAKKYLIYPSRMSSYEVVFASSSAWPTGHLQEAANALGASSWRLVITTEDAILEAINKGYDRTGGTAEEAAEGLEGDEELTDLFDLNEEVEDLLDAQDEEPIKKLMNSILFQAIKDRSSDIHIDPTPQNTQVRSRVDGVLNNIAQVPRQGHIPLVNRVKVMAGLDISTKNQPQDGRSMVLLGGKKVDIRVSIIPTVHGERAVLRLLNQSQGIIALSSLGIDDRMQKELDALIHRPHGIMLVTGPTGAGKTTTLYSCLNQIDAKQKNIVTIEDPVEYRIPEYGQMQLNEKIGVTFAKGLRAMLRQDPDVIMVGEMRDSETAQIAIQAALTGHLVLSTLHTNDASSSVIRLVDMGIEPFLVSSTIAGILAQRLVRRICEHCKESYEIEQSELDQLALTDKVKSLLTTKLHRGKGCDECKHTGYQGRLGVYELLTMNDQIRHAIAQGADASGVKDVAIKSGMRSLAEDAALKVRQGITTLEEMLRVVNAEAS